ncbi:MAG TPA: glutamyl-tRNA amidotransferase [Prochlorococcaceae cyanobacterium Fu_MAG_50]|nr:glutamyl-tRNA amidotransferase [Prochlorococcaceae cyanobacterium Fu_MAG_50]
MQIPSSAIALALMLLIASPSKAEDIDLKIKLARKRLATSIRAYVTATVAFSNCQVEHNRISKKMARDALPQALLEVGISPEVLINPQVAKAASMLRAKLNSDCRATKLSTEEAIRLIEDEL